MNPNVRVDSAQYCYVNNIKVILLIVDALRYDFTEFNDNISSSLTPHFKNKLKVIRGLLKSAPDRTKLFKFLADPPTFTSQRLSGLTTGSLPTFKEIKSNIDTQEITEDNLIDQLVRAKKNITFMGDAVLSLMYPGRFKRQFSYPAFHLRDLDSIDSKIKNQIFEEMQNDDWDLIIAHFPGVDHCGHYFGPNHKEMGRKLLEMNDVISKVTSKMDNKTMMFVIGDHGMTATGNHGGGSELEVTSALFVHSPWSFISNVKQAEEVWQVDLVPTLATIMGVPIPFSNVGSTILSVLPSFEPKPDLRSNWVYVLTNLWTNLKQITLYIQEYEKTKEQFPPEDLLKIKENFKRLKVDLKNIHNEEELKQFIDDFYMFMHRVRKMCEQAWAQINIYTMLGGVFSFFTLCALAFLLFNYLSLHYLDEIVGNIFIYFVYGILILTAIALITLKYLGFLFNVEEHFYICVCTISVGFLATIAITRFKSVVRKSIISSEGFTKIFFLTKAIIFFSVAGYTSNNYIVNEAFYSSSFLFIALISTCVTEVKGELHENIKLEELDLIRCLKYFLLSTRGRAIKLTLILFTIMRVSVTYNVCRPDQKCTQETSMFPDTVTCFISISLVIFFTLCCSVLCFQKAGKLVEILCALLLSCFAPTAVVVLTMIYWILQLFPQQKLFILEPYQLTLLPCVAVCILLLSLILLLSPPCIIPSSDNCLLTSLVMVFRRKDTDGETYCVTAVHKMVTFIKVSLMLTLLAALLLGYKQGAAAVLLTTSLWLTAIVSSLAGEGHVPCWSVISWGLSCQHFYFATGHQATFSSIDWNSASLLSSDSSLTSPVISAALVLSNVFSSHILHAVLLPLLIVVPQVLSPPSRTVHDEHTECFERTANVLMEQDSQIQGMFKLCVQYMSFLGLRVLVCLLVVFWKARHIMVWDIFAPKLIFEIVAFMISLPAMMMGFFIFTKNYQKTSCLLQNLTQS